MKVVDSPFGKRPFRVHIDPAQDGAEIVNGLADRVRAELLRNIGLGDLLTPRADARPAGMSSHGAEVRADASRRVPARRSLAE